MKPNRILLQLALFMGWLAGQNVGIGTNSPTERLHVAGNLRLDNAFMPGNQAGQKGDILISQGANTPPIWLASGAAGTILVSQGAGNNPVWAANPICTSPTQNRFLKFTSTSPTTACNTTLAENASDQIWNADGGAPLAGDKFSIIATGALSDAINGYATTGIGVYGQATGANGRGVYGFTNQATGIGVLGVNTTTSPGVVGLSGGVNTYYGNTAGSFSSTNTGVTAWASAGSGTGIVAAGNGQTPNYLTAGSGGAFRGTNTGSVSWATNAAGTGVIGAGNNQTAYFLADGSGGAFTGTNTGSSSWATNAAGTGVIGAGNNQTAYFLTAGSGGAFTGSTIGVYGYAATNGNNRWGGYFANASGDYVYVGGRTVGGVQRKVEGTGSVNTVVTSVTGERVLLSAPEAPENLFMDFGKGRLQNGYAYVRLDPNFSKNIVVNERHPLRVFITLAGDCKGVYVTNTSAEGFEVRELQGGTSNVEFYWQVVANRADEYDAFGRRIPYSEERFPLATPPPPVIQAEGVPVKAVSVEAVPLKANEMTPKGNISLPPKGKE